MIKDFKTYIGEGTLWGNTIMRSDTDRIRKEDEITEEVVRSFIFPKWENECRKVTIRKENGKPVVDIEGSYYTNEDITEIPFQFGTVTCNFDCGCCDELTSLKGCPKEVHGNFYCDECKSLTSLEGCPERVYGDFDCSDCSKQFTEEEVRQLCEVGGEIYV